MINILLQTSSAPVDFNIIYSLLKEHAGLAILGVVLFLIWKYAGDVGSFFKDYFNKKIDAESKKVGEIQKQNDKFFDLYENNTEAVKKVSEAISSFEKAFIGSEARTSEKILGVESRIGEKIHGMESRLTEKISSSAKEVVQHSRLDKLAAEVHDPPSVKMQSTTSKGSICPVTMQGTM